MTNQNNTKDKKLKKILKNQNKKDVSSKNSNSDYGSNNGEFVAEKALKNADFKNLLFGEKNKGKFSSLDG